MTTKHKITRTKFDQSQALETFEKYKETGNGKILRTKENQGGYSSAYAEGWTRIFGKKEEKEDEEEFSEEDFQDGVMIKEVK